jgi:Fe-S cluster assembly protein SufD
MEADRLLPLDGATIERLDAGAPPWVAAKRAEGFAIFRELPAPDPRAEEWRYVDLDFEIGDYALRAEPGTAAPADGGFEAALGTVAGRAALVDGACVDINGAPALSSLRSAAEGLADAVQQVEGRGVPADLDLFSAGHHAFGSDGVFLHAAAGTSITDPFLIDVQATTAGTVSFPKVAILVEENADVSVIIHYRSPAGAMLVVPQVIADVSGRLRLTAVQEWGPQTNAISQVRLSAHGDASVHLGEIGLGGALARLHLTVDLEGRGSHGEVSGLYFGDRSQVLDYRAFVNHRAPNTTSEMFLKGAVEDEADSVFTGLIRIEPAAQKTNAYQTNRNLVLSEGAEAQSVPNLEILANDVRCGHGSTVGPLDEEQRYYLMTRGLERQRADRLQVRGFFEEAIKRLPSRRLAGPMRERVNAKYIEAQREGRV